MAVMAIMRLHGDPNALYSAYERVEDRLTSEDDTKFVFHGAGTDADGLVLFEVVESEAEFQRLWNDPMLTQVASEEGMPADADIDVEFVPLRRHHVDP